MAKCKSKPNFKYHTVFRFAGQSSLAMREVHLYGGCEVKAPHPNQPHWNKFLGYWGHGKQKPVVGIKCMSCKHDKLDHKLWSIKDYKPNSTQQPQCFACSEQWNKDYNSLYDSFINYKVPKDTYSHILHHTVEWTGTHIALIKARWLKKQTELCNTCHHELQYHKNNYNKTKWPICQLCDIPVCVHKYDELPNTKKLAQLKCKVCKHKNVDHKDNMCLACGSLYSWSAADMQELILMRHEFMYPWWLHGGVFNQSMSEEQQVCIDHGVDPTRFRLAQACADYYLLERMVHDGSTAAKKYQKERENEIANVLSTYMEMAVGGEGRHAPRILFHRDSYSCEGYGNWECRGCNEAGCCCSCDTWNGRRSKSHIMKDNIPVVHHDEDARYFKWGREFGEFLIEAEKGGGRDGAWNIWMQYRERYGVSILNQLVDCYQNEDWGGSFGGSAWGLCTEVLRDWRVGTLSTHLFLDRCWTLEHNGGSLFNKAFNQKDISWLMKVLQHQAEDDYKFLYKHASIPVKRMWETRTYGLNREDRWERVKEFSPLTNARYDSDGYPIRYRYGFEDRSPEWVGRQITDEERERW